MHAPAPDASATRALILVLAASGFASTFAGRIAEPLVTVIARDLAADPKTIALLSAAYTLPYAFIQPILGPVGDGIGKAKVMKVCLAILCATLVASCFAPNAETLFALRVVSGGAAGGVIPLALAMIGDRVGMEGRQVAISRFLVSVIMGQLAGSALAGVLEGYLTWRGVFALAAAVAALGWGASILRLRARGTPPGVSIAGALARYRELLGNPRARALFGFVFVEAIAIFGVFPYVAVLLEIRGEGGAREAGLVLGAFALGGLAYTALVGLMLRHLGLARMLAGGGILSGLALAGLTLGGSWQLEALAVGALGLGFYMLHNSYQTQVTEVSPTGRASAVALHAFSFFVGQALGVVLMGQGIASIGPGPTLGIAALMILAVGLGSALVLAPGAKPQR